MTKIKSVANSAPYKVEIETSSNNHIVADVPKDKGGNDEGFSPEELILAALAACTSATVKMFAQRKDWDLQAINTEISLDTDEDHKTETINRKIELTGNLDAEQRKRLLAVANACPIHKLLSNPIKINTEIVE